MRRLNVDYTIAARLEWQVNAGDVIEEEHGYPTQRTSNLDLSDISLMRSFAIIYSRSLRLLLRAKQFVNISRTCRADNARTDDNTFVARALKSTSTTGHSEVYGKPYLMECRLFWLLAKCLAGE